ncbi:MAG: DMT family transporter [Oscillospiraceae bacterium]
MKKQTAIFCLFLVSLIWGTGFVATKMALDFGVTVGITNAVRGLIFSAMVFLFFRKSVVSMSAQQLKIGLLAGVFNVLGFLLQTIGAQYTAPSSSAFITTTNVVIVPFLGWIFLRQRPKMKNFIATGLCLFGMAIITGVLTSGLTFNVGDLYTIACAFAYAMSLVLLAKRPEGGHFAAGAFLMGLTHFLGGLIYFVLVEGAAVPDINWKIAILPVIYLGLGSSFVAQTLQVAAQRYVSASTAALILMLEGVWGCFFSILFGYEGFTLSLLVGGALIIASLVLSEVDGSKILRNKIRKEQDK